LRQGGVRTEHQAEILSAISAFRAEYAGSPGEMFHRAQLAHPAAFERLLRTIEWKLIEMPIPRLQVVGRSEEDRFLYEYGWTQAIKRGPVSAYQAGDPSAFDNRLLLRPGIAESLIALNGVLRPVIRREWSLMVAEMNALTEQTLEAFLFGAARVALDAVRAPLRDLQRGRCFYCECRLDARADVDHPVGAVAGERDRQPRRRPRPLQQQEAGLLRGDAAPRAMDGAARPTRGRPRDHRGRGAVATRPREIPRGRACNVLAITRGGAALGRWRRVRSDRSCESRPGTPDRMMSPRRRVA
jgi:hypothetical protein